MTVYIDCDFNVSLSIGPSRVGCFLSVVRVLSPKLSFMTVVYYWCNKTVAFVSEKFVLVLIWVSTLLLCSMSCIFFRIYICCISGGGSLSSDAIKSVIVFTPRIP